jgi:hypothetical protein
MKIKLLSTLAVAAGISSLPAQTVIDITGSTAGRASVHQSILSTLGAGATYGYTGSSFTGASQAIFKGTYAGQSVVVRTSWSGSATGLSDLVTGNTVNFIATTTDLSANNVSNLTAGTPDSAEVAFSDVFVGTTNVPSAGLVNTNTFILPFKWVASNEANNYSAFKNVTPLQARALLASGTLPLSFFTGNSADAEVLVIATGRDNGSGTRITALADIGYGVNTFVTQSQVNVSGNNITGYSDFIVSGVANPNYGYTSGGTLAGVLNKASTGDAAGTIVLSYLGLSDAATALGGATPGKELTYNGVAYSAAAVETGEYSFWGYLHLYYKNSLTGVSKTFSDALGVALRSNPGSSGLNPSAMGVSRATDGGTILPN